MVAVPEAREVVMEEAGASAAGQQVLWVDMRGVAAKAEGVVVVVATLEASAEGVGK